MRGGCRHAHQYELWLLQELFTHLGVCARSYALEKRASIRTEFSGRHVKISQAAVGDAIGKPLLHRTPAGLCEPRGWLKLVCNAAFLAPVAEHARMVWPQVSRGAGSRSQRGCSADPFAFVFFCFFAGLATVSKCAGSVCIRLSSPFSGVLVSSGSAATSSKNDDIGDQLHQS